MFFESRGAFSPDSPFEFVLVSSPQLVSKNEAYPDRDAFAEHFVQKDNASPCCAVFDNLSGQSRLIAPLPVHDGNKHDAVFSHLGIFVRDASPSQVLGFWQTAASELVRALDDPTRGTVWFSTAGMGVAWLHLRLDPQPKYYSFNEYRNEAKRF